MILEVCADSVASAVAAERGGAHRIELCSNLLEGGITPGPGLIAAVRSRLSIGIHVMIRPRGGSFLYSKDEFEVMQRDIDEVRRLGADGFVLGILRPDGSVDVDRTRELVNQSHPLPITFHRAIDVTPDPLVALEAVISTGASRVLSSGRAPNALDGAAMLRKMKGASRGRITIMAGGGITLDTVKQVAQTSGVSDFHASLRRVLAGSMDFPKLGEGMGEVVNGEYLRETTREEDVRSMLDTLGTLPVDNMAKSAP